MIRRLRKFEPRAYRYVLRAGDRQIMRYSPESTQGSASVDSTVLINLSETGLAFLVDASTELRVRERIKVEIPIPGGDQIAWWGRVVRIEEYSPGWNFGKKDPFADASKFLVGVRFEQMPDQHSRAIRKGIEKSFMQIMKEQQYRSWIYYRRVAFDNLTKFLLIAAVATAAAIFMYMITRPSANYDAEKGAPWGERFKF